MDHNEAVAFAHKFSIQHSILILSPCLMEDKSSNVELFIELNNPLIEPLQVTESLVSSHPIAYNFGNYYYVFHVLKCTWHNLPSKETLSLFCDYEFHKSTEALLSQYIEATPISEITYM